MKNPMQQPDITRRKFLALLGTLPWLSTCEGTHRREQRQAYEARQRAECEALSPEEKRLHDHLRRKFKGIHGVVLRVDAASQKNWTSITSDTGQHISRASSLNPRNVSNQTNTDNSMPIPRAIRAIWRESVTHSGGQGRWEGGTIVGDYTVPVAERIPDSLLDYIRQNGGALRLKIRLVDDGVLIGWDVEHVIPLKDWKHNSLGLGSGVSYRLPGGDFCEARLFEGKRGWHLDKNGEKVFTDY